MARQFAVGSPSGGESIDRNTDSRCFRFDEIYNRCCRDVKAQPSETVVKFAQAYPRPQKLCLTHCHLRDGDVEPLIHALSKFSVCEFAVNFNDHLTDKGCKALLDFVLVTPSISSLELLGNRMTEKTCPALAEALQQNNLTRLKIGDNKLGPVGARWLAKGLALNLSLNQLHLGGSNIGDAGVIALVAALEKNRTLTSMGLRDNNIGPLGMEALARFLARKDCPFVELQIKGNRIADLGASHLAVAIRTNCLMRVLEVQSNCIGPSGCTALCLSLLKNTTIYAINMNDNQICDAGAAALGQMLQENATITTIGVSKNHISQQGAHSLSQALGRNTALTGLDLGSNQLGDEGTASLASALARSQHLVSIDLHSNSVHLEGMVALAQALLQNQSLRHIDVGSNFSRNPGAFAWARVIEVNTVLTRLCLTDNEIGHTGGEALRHAMLRNTTLRNFCFGGQSTEHPCANHIAADTRRVINSAVSRNKALYLDKLRAADPSSADARQPMVNKHVVNSYRNRPVPAAMARYGDMPKSKIPPLAKATPLAGCRSRSPSSQSLSSSSQQSSQDFLAAPSVADWPPSLLSPMAKGTVAALQPGQSADSGKTGIVSTEEPFDTEPFGSWGLLSSPARSLGTPRGLGGDSPLPGGWFAMSPIHSAAASPWEPADSELSQWSRGSDASLLEPSAWDHLADMEGFTA